MAVTTHKVPLEDQIPGPETRAAWVIDIDYTATANQKSSFGNMAGVGGPRGTIGLPIEKPDRWRILDQEGTPILEGRTNAATIAADSDGKVDGFEPLDDIGRGKYIEYLRGEKWVRLKDGDE